MFGLMQVPPFRQTGLQRAGDTFRYILYISEKSNLRAQIQVVWYNSVPSSRVPELHVGPYQPGLHSQTSGETHSPPFSQCLLHTTETDRCHSVSYRKSNFMNEKGESQKHLTDFTSGSDVSVRAGAQVSGQTGSSVLTRRLAARCTQTHRVNDTRTLIIIL